MSHTEAENLSALVDDELSSDEVRFMLRRTGQDASLCATWTRYHLMGDAMRKDVLVLAEDNFADEVMQSIGNADTKPRSRGSYRWLRWSAGGAIAAGVAVAALTMLPPQMHDATTVASTASSSQQMTGSQRVTGVAQANVPAAPHVDHATAPRWLSAAPPAAQMAQAAAADVASGPRIHSVPSGGYGEELAPYMTLPIYRAPQTQHARQAMQQLRMVTPQRGQVAPASSQARAH